MSRRGCFGCGCPKDEQTPGCLNCWHRHYARRRKADPVSGPAYLERIEATQRAWRERQPPKPPRTHCRGRGRHPLPPDHTGPCQACLKAGIKATWERIKADPELLERKRKLDREDKRYRWATDPEYRERKLEIARRSKARRANDPAHVAHVKAQRARYRAKRQQQAQEGDASAE
jgi:hypothetical protein